MQLVIAEKPSVAQSIARVIGAGEKKDGYMEGNGFLVSWCIGHLVELAQPDAYFDTWKKWSYESLPMIPEEWQTEVKSDTAAQYKVLKGLMHDARVDSVVCATDAGREGELIFRLVYDQAGCDKPIKRLWISSMEESAIRAGFENLRLGSDYENLYHSALCRQRADWLVGLNGTRLFTVLYGGKMLKVGRVQTPTLAMLVEREEKIRNFKKEQYYLAHILMDGIDAATERIDDKTHAESIAAACEGGAATVVSVKKEEKTVQPPKLYDLTTLQRDANRLFGFTAKQTLEYAQSLYEKKLATYPRTDSQFLSDDMEQTARGVIEAVFGSILFQEDVLFNPDIKRVMNSKKVTDHHAIIPTMEIARADLAALPEPERKVLSLIANRLLCATGEKHLYETVRAEVSCGGHVFAVSGKSVTHNGWKFFEDAFKRSYKIKGNKDEENGDKKLPKLTEGQVFDGVQTKISEHFTSAPKRFTEDSLLSAMERAGAEDMGDDVERKGLGTPATRADIIEKLVKDGFVKREKTERSSVCRLIPTEDGVKLITVLPDVVKSPKLTADWENTLTLVAKGEYSMQEFMGGIEDMVKDLVQTYHSVSDEQKAMFGSSTQEALGKCPKCGGDVVKGKFGAYCKNKCGMNVSRAMGTALTDSQIKSMLAGKKILVKGLRGKKGSYDAYLIPEGIEDYSYTKDGKEIKGSQYRVRLEFPKRKNN
ncbi:MAG: DNA topoisomerase 3 [Lachnospiraceae bacterium]|nr:DNA topoisomerase 3 [Lachnospiraceae bacterium]